MESYEQCLKTMFSLRRFGIKLGLDVITQILTGLGNPQTAYRTIHVAGTNGKGSVASMLTGMLQAAGDTVGLYTSPHLIHFNERIRINGRPVSDAEIVDAYRAVRKVQQGDREPTFFEFTTAMALLLFKQHKVDWAVIETGMGGRLDATNVLAPELSIITNISLEHKGYLGNTIATITYEKAGIIKPRIPVITGVRQPSAVAVVTERAAKLGAPCYRMGRDFRCRRLPSGAFHYTGLDHHWRNLTTNLLGRHQVDNAGLALAAAEVLMRKGVAIDETHVRHALTHTTWPGRLETVCEEPLIILDGAHNLAAARNLGRYLEETYPERDIIMVAGILDDKPAEEMLAALLPVCRCAVITSPTINRAIPAEELARIAKRFVDEVDEIPTVDRAVARALQIVESGQVIVIAGSLYVVGEALKTLQEMGLTK
jgi:dihydrofolate synthase / folylpolyglutamate synthase